jgi:hypothetical protein
VGTKPRKIESSSSSSGFAGPQVPWTHSSAWIGLPPDRKLSMSSPVRWYTLRRVESSMAKAGARDRVNADDGLLPGIRLLFMTPQKST